MTRPAIALSISLVTAVSLATIGVLTPRAAAAQQRPDQAPVVRFHPVGIGLEEAVNLTLQNAPPIKLQDTEVQRAAGVEQEARGQFDASLLSRFDYTYRIQELTEERKANERL